MGICIVSRTSGATWAHSSLGPSAEYLVCDLVQSSPRASVGQAGQGEAPSLQKGRGQGGPSEAPLPYQDLGWDSAIFPLSSGRRVMPTDLRNSLRP